MTDKEKLDAIRAEIHRLVDVRGYDKEMANDLFAFMNSLPNEPVSEDLEEEIIRYIGYPQEVDEDVSTTMIRKAARHFANWQKQQDSKLPKIWPRDTIEEYAYQCAYDLSNDWAKETPEWNDVQNACILGAKWQKEKDDEEKVLTYKHGFDACKEYIKEHIKEVLLSEVLPCFMHGGEADEVVAMLDYKIMKDE